MARSKSGKRSGKASGGRRRPRVPAEIKAYSGSGFHTPGKYGTSERRVAGREIDRERG